ncbi:MAG: acyl-CoA dehydrogenase [Bdellovibrionales bacterium GWA2_49_15]|nr:MAG: acyl-CoA dehydrogenase [Bdellovibrionales bacterium GWA2_49_15]HAZ13114.1 acyl-CoA dehydrogenase [Bdellovibrionales bacterium]
MNFYHNFLDETHLALRESCTRFALKEIAPHAFEWEEAGTFPRELYTKAAQAGVLGVGFPEEMGGAGGGPLHTIMSIEGQMRGGSTGVSIGLGSLAIALPPIVHSKNSDLIERFVRPTLAGKKIAALAVTEPGAGSDVANIRTRAERQGDHYKVNGSKLFITSGVRADFLTTLVRTSDDPHTGLSFLLIEKDMPGVAVSRALKKTGWWASDTAELSFNNVQVPMQNLIGSEGAGFTTLMRNFQMERLALAAYGCATAQIAMEESERYARERKVFGKTLWGFQVTRHKLAEMATRVLAATTLTYQVAARMEQKDNVMKEVAMAKNFAAETAISVTHDAVQLFGGMGYMRETLVERLSRDARLLSIGGGTHEIMNEIIGKCMEL